MATEETLKKLLEDLAEKETLIAEEIKVVVDEIAQLEANMEVCKRRLSTISADRQKVLAMRDRYLSGNISPQSAAASAAAVDGFAHALPAQPAVLSTPAADQPANALPAQAAVVSTPIEDSRANEPPAHPATNLSSGSGIAIAPSADAALSAPPAHQPINPLPGSAAVSATPADASVGASPASAAPIPSGQAYPPPEITAPQAAPSAAAVTDPGSAQAQNATPLQELRKRFGLANILGGKKTEQKPPEMLPEVPWQANPESSGAAAKAGDPGVTTVETPTFELLKQEQAAAQAARAQASNVSPAPPVTPPGSGQVEQQAPTDEEQKSEEEKDNDTVKSINDALRSLFR